MIDKNAKTIEKLRQKFLNEYETNPELYHQIDVERVRTDNWQIERFILDNEDSEEDAYKQLIRSLRWKKSFGIHERNDQYFPKEFYTILGIEKYSWDKVGRLVLWTSSKHYIKIVEVSQLFQQFLAHQIERIDSKAGREGWVSVNDATREERGGLIPVDVGMGRFRVDMMKHYPQGVRLALILDLPWVLNSLYKLFQNFMNRSLRDRVILAKKATLRRYVDMDEVPKSFGGNRDSEMDDLLKDFSPLHELPHLGLTDAQIDNFYDTYNSLFQRT